MTYRDIAQKLRKLGCIEESRRSGGSHRRWYNPKTGTAASLPDWGPKDIRLGTLRAALAQLGIAWSDFQSL